MIDMFHYRQVSSELLILMLFLLLFAFVFAADYLLMPEISAPQVSIKVNF
ncbi:MAG: hypothetical protein Q9M89_01170 [Persephonella sp.]|nr:hypothetical protein [Persephonella sp.]